MPPKTAPMDASELRQQKANREHREKLAQVESSFLGDNYQDQPLWRRLNWLHVPLLVSWAVLRAPGAAARAARGVCAASYPSPRAVSRCVVSPRCTSDHHAAAGRVRAGDEHMALQDVRVGDCVLLCDWARHHRGLPSVVVTQGLQRTRPGAVGAHVAGLWRRGGQHPLVVPRPPRTPQVRGHGPRSLRRYQGLPARTHRYVRCAPAPSFRNVSVVCVRRLTDALRIGATLQAGCW